MSNTAVQEKKPVKIVETVLRDAHQFLLATRMSTAEMLPIAVHTAYREAQQSGIALRHADMKNGAYPV